jgi:diketogulonate reductase-like aldo/keto reductase
MHRTKGYRAAGICGVALSLLQLPTACSGYQSFRAPGSTMALRGGATRAITIMEMPPIMYGTAWKKERTEELVIQAVRLGFRGVDTACQPKHYYEPGVGAALRRLEQEGIGRDKLFIQTKYTPIGGQDQSKPLPYDPASPIPQQVEQSVMTSLHNLNTSYINSLVLHSPLPSHADNMVGHSLCA